MQELLYDLAAEVFSVVLLGLGAAVLTTLGVLTEGAGVANLADGHTALGLWYVYMGGVALYVGLYLLAYRMLRPRLASLSDRTADGTA